MGWLSFLLGVVAGALFFKTGHVVLLSLSIVFSIGGLWSWGVMHNYATESAKRRLNYSGGFFDITAHEANSVPNWITSINMLSSVAALILLIIAIIMAI